MWLFAPDPSQHADGPEGKEPAHRLIIRHVHSAGIKAIVQVGTVTAAREAVEDGADVVAAQGVDAGGHQFAQGAGVISLVPEVRAMLDTEYPDKGVGLAAAGGIVDERGVAAALALGAFYVSVVNNT